MRRTLMLLGLFALVVAVATSSWAQATSTLSGTVRDASGAVVPGASITVKNQASGDERKTVSTKEGIFSVPALHAGTYTVKVEAKGFANYTATDIALTSNDAKSIQVSLPLATVTDTVEVSAQTTSIVVEDSGAKGQTVSSDDIQNMVLGSRNATDIVKLMSGATMSSNSGVNRPSTTTAIGINTYVTGGSASGMQGTQMNGQSLDITIDGSHTFDPGAPGANSTVNPNTDMISEVKVLASSFSAENDYGPVVINVATKGGGDKYHGQVHFYAQNAAMNSKDAFAKWSKAPKLDAHQYYPGGSIGGPIPLPFTSYNKKHDKLFFWNGLELYRQLLDGGVARAVVPTADMWAGHFTTQAMSGLLNTALLNKVPSLDLTKPWAQWYQAHDATWASRCSIDAVGNMSQGCIYTPAYNLLRSYYPDPNADPTTHDGYNYIRSTLAGDNSWQNTSRVDWSVSDNTKVFVRYSAQRENNEQPMGVWGGTSGDAVLPNPSGAIGKYSSDNLVVSLTHVFSPTMTSESTFSWAHTGMPNYPKDQSKIGRQELGLPLSIFGNDSIPKVLSWGGSFATVGPGGVFTGNPLAQHATKMTPSAKEQVTKVWGAHTFKAGGFWEYVKNDQDPCCGWGGQFTMSASQGSIYSTGNAFADVMMGITGGGYSEGQPTPSIGIYSQQMRFFVTDHWKLTRRLTIDAGLRFDHFGRPAPDNGLGMATFLPGAYVDDPATLNYHTGVYWHSINSAVPLSGVRSRPFFYSPRFGLAYDVFGNGGTVVRGGYGKFRAYDKIVGDNQSGAATLAYGAGTVSCDNNNNATGSCPTWAAVPMVLGQYSNRPMPGPLPTGQKIGITTVNPNMDEQPLVTTYNLQIDQKLPAKFMLEVAYVGNYGDHNTYQQDLNAIPVGKVDPTFLFNCTAAKNCPNFGNTAGYRPRQNYTNIWTTMEAGKTQYDGLQVSLHRSVGIVSLMANYTWSKSYANTVVGNGGAFSSLPDNGRSEYWGVSRETRPQTLNLTYTVNVPKVRTSNRILSGAANGWQIAGVTSINSGVNLTASGGNNLGYSYDDLWSQKPDANGKMVNDKLLAMHSGLYYTGGDTVTIFPTLVCNPMMKKKVVLPTGREGVQFLNPDCFKATSSGLGSTHLPYLGGPAYWNSDLGITKHFRVNEKQSLDLKLQGFNFLNHALWSFNGGDVNMKLNYDGNGVLKSQTGNQKFGTAIYKYGRRTVQVEARYTF